jgi:hypothetical protein
MTIDHQICCLNFYFADNLAAPAIQGKPVRMVEVETSLRCSASKVALTEMLTFNVKESTFWGKCLAIRGDANTQFFGAHACEPAPPSPKSASGPGDGWWPYLSVHNDKTNTMTAHPTFNISSLHSDSATVNVEPLITVFTKEEVCVVVCSINRNNLPSLYGFGSSLYPFA